MANTAFSIGKRSGPTFCLLGALVPGVLGACGAFLGRYGRVYQPKITGQFGLVLSMN